MFKEERISLFGTEIVTFSSEVLGSYGSLSGYTIQEIIKQSELVLHYSVWQLHTRKHCLTNSTDQMQNKNK